MLTLWELTINSQHVPAAAHTHMQTPHTQVEDTHQVSDRGTNTAPSKVQSTQSQYKGWTLSPYREMFTFDLHIIQDASNSCCLRCRKVSYSPEEAFSQSSLKKLTNWIKSDYSRVCIEHQRNMETDQMSLMNVENKHSRVCRSDRIEQLKHNISVLQPPGVHNMLGSAEQTWSDEETWFWVWSDGFYIKNIALVCCLIPLRRRSHLLYRTWAGCRAISTSGQSQTITGAAVLYADTSKPV